MSNFTPINDETLKLVYPELDLTEASGLEVRNEKNTYLCFYTQSLMSLPGLNNPGVSRLLYERMTKIQQGEIAPSLVYDKLTKNLAASQAKKLDKLILLPEAAPDSLLEKLSIKEKNSFLLLGELADCKSEKVGLIRDENIFFLKEGSLFFDLKAFKKALKDHKKELAGVIISPFLPECGAFLAPSEAQAIEKEVRRRKLRLIINESLSFPYRSENLYAFDALSIRPDAVLFSSWLYGNRSISFCLTTKKLYKKQFDSIEPELSGAALSSSVMLSTILDVLKDSEHLKELNDIAYRFSRKLRALSHNHGKYLRIQSWGFTFYLNFTNQTLSERVLNYLREEGILLYAAKDHPETLVFSPPLCFNSFEIDRLVDRLNRFFETKLQLQ